MHLLHWRQTCLRWRLTRFALETNVLKTHVRTSATHTRQPLSNRTYLKMIATHRYMCSPLKTGGSYYALVLTSKYTTPISYIYPMRKPWIWAIRGLPSANHGSMLCATIHELFAQTVDPHFAEHRVKCHKLKGQDRREGLSSIPSATQGDITNLYLGLGILHCSFGGLG